MLSVKIIPYVHKLTNDTALLWFTVDCTSKQEKFGGWTSYIDINEFFNTQQLSIKHLLEISNYTFDFPKGVKHLIVYVKPEHDVLEQMRGTVDVRNHECIDMSTYRQRTCTRKEWYTARNIINKYRRCQRHLRALGMSLLSGAIGLVISSAMLALGWYLKDMFMPVLANWKSWHTIGAGLVVFAIICILNFIICQIPCLPGLYYNSWEGEYHQPIFGDMIGYLILLFSFSLASHFNWPLWILITAGFGLSMFYNIYNTFIDYND